MGAQISVQSTLAEIKFWKQWSTCKQKEISKFFGLAEFCLMPLFFATCICPKLHTKGKEIKKIFANYWCIF